MVADITALGNLALQLVGEPQISDIHEPDNRAGRELALAWPTVRDEVCGDHDWNFNRERVSIPKLGTTPSFKYKYEYQQPDDAIRIWSVDETYVRWGVDLPGGQDEFGSGTEFVPEGGMIRTDKDVITDLNIVDVIGLPVTYSKRVENPVLYPVWLVPVLYTRLAMSICQALTGDRQILADVSAMYDSFFKKARARNAQQGVTERPLANFVAVRE